MGVAALHPSAAILQEMDQRMHCCMRGARGTCGHERCSSAAALPIADLFGLVAFAHAATYDTHLTRAPYLTDLVGLHVIVNFATDQTGTAASVSYGPFDGTTCTLSSTQSCDALDRQGRKRQRVPVEGLAHAPERRPVLLPACCSARPTCSAPARSPVFTTQAAAGSTQPFSFAVFGDWGLVDANGNNPDQQNLLGTLAGSGVRFAVTTGDNGYPVGQPDELRRSPAGRRRRWARSSVARFWPVPGASVPLFTASGNHGLSGTTHADLTNWPQDVAVVELGRPLSRTTSTAASTARRRRTTRVRGTRSTPGRARFYVLDVGLGRHQPRHGQRLRERLRGALRTGHARVRVAARRPQAHPSGLKFAFSHYPFYSRRQEPGLRHVHRRAELARGPARAVRRQHRVQRALAHLRAQPARARRGIPGHATSPAAAAATLEPIGTVPRVRCLRPRLVADQADGDRIAAARRCPRPRPRSSTSSR